MTNSKLLLEKKASDILTIIDICYEVGWASVTKKTIERILYFSSVLFLFVNPSERNIFSDYPFLMDPEGPKFYEIESILTFLESGSSITKTDQGYELDKESYEKSLPLLLQIDDFQKKREWFRTIIILLAQYGENKVYDFIFRDAEYQDNYKRNNRDGLINTGFENHTIELLNEFKGAFEDSIGKENLTDVSSNRYLELYFDYIFSKILAGEVNL